MDTAAASAPQLKTPAEDRNTKQVQLDGFERLASCQPGVKEKTRDSEHEKEVMKCRLSAYFFFIYSTSKRVFPTNISCQFPNPPVLTLVLFGTVVLFPKFIPCSISFVVFMPLPTFNVLLVSFNSISTKCVISAVISVTFCLKIPFRYPGCCEISIVLSMCFLIR